MRIVFFAGAAGALALCIATRADAILGCTKDSDCPGSICGVGICTGDALHPGVCGVEPAFAGKVCRSAAGPCDLAEVCDGKLSVCPILDKKQPSGHVCRASRGACDVAEVCDGDSVQCPPDLLLGAGVACRPSQGACDVTEVCDGANPACPPDTFKPATTVCRASTGACDPAEFCTGNGAACPADQLTAAGTICRAKAGDCDVAESCDGVHGACPADALATAGTICRPAANDCDVAESCTGSSKVCPGDQIAANGTACENASACISGGSCAGPVCIGGQPELTFTPDSAQFSQPGSQVDIVIKHTGSGGPISLTGASVQPSGVFSIVAGPQFPLSLASGAQDHVTVRVDAATSPGEYAATLLLQATSCADQPVQLHASIAAPSPDAGTGTDGGTGTGSGAGSSASASSESGKGGGCSSGASPTGMFALTALAALLARRRYGRV